MVTMDLKLTWDETKRQASLTDRGLDFADAGKVIDRRVVEWQDVRRDYGEVRMVCYGYLHGRLVVVGYVQRGESHHIFSMRKANEREQARFGQ